MTQIDDDTFRVLLAEFDAAEAAVEEICRPYDKARAAVYSAREAFLEAHETHIVDRCEECREPILAGDRYHHNSEDGLSFCEEHAPTYGDTLDSWKQQESEELAAEDTDDAMLTEIRERIAHIEGLVAEHGADAKAVWTADH